MEQYFDSGLIKFVDEEMFVDCGTWIGDTIVEFADKAKNSFGKVYAFEANNNLFPVMETVLELKKIKDKVKVFACAVASFNGKIEFAERAYTGGGRVAADNDKNSTIVTAVKLDDVLADEKVTFIKMDIEGAELDALKGSEILIKKNRPKLAICIYHNNAKDLWTVPMYLMEKHPYYRFYVRHYDRNSPSETVLYCIPEV